jgi:hypothetical protein
MILRVILNHRDTLELLQRITLGSCHWASTQICLHGSRVPTILVTERQTKVLTRIGKLRLQEAYASAMLRIVDIASSGPLGPSGLSYQAADSILQIALFNRIKYPTPTHTKLGSAMIQMS